MPTIEFSVTVTVPRYDPSFIQKVAEALQESCVEALECDELQDTWTHLTIDSNKLEAPLDHHNRY